MEKIIKGFAVLMMGFVMVEATLYAETITGEVAAIDQVTHSISIRHVDLTTGNPQEEKFYVVDNAKFKGVHSLSDLKTGDMVKVEVKENKDSGVLEAKKIEMAQMDKQ